MPDTRPVTALSDAEARLLRDYQTWLGSEELTRHLWCTGCQERVDVHLEPGQMGLICACRVLIWNTVIH